MLGLMRCLAEELSDTGVSTMALLPGAIDRHIGAGHAGVLHGRHHHVVATLGGYHAAADADSDGHFAVTFPARAASAEAVALHVSDGSDTVATAENLVIGDVWLCSGQSNMAFTVAAGLNGYNNIQSSADPLLRMINVPLDTAASPQREFGGEAEWKAAAPDTTGAFSAACYYMLRDLRETLGIPMGAVHASWGGSQIRPWLTPEGGAALYGADQMALLEGFSDDPLAAVAAFAPVYEAWWRESTGGQEPWNDASGIQWTPVPQIGPWNNWTGSPLAQNGVANVLLRRTISLTAEQAGTGGVLNIGIIDDLDATWVNGHAVGFTHGWGTEREYRVPPESLRAGENEVLVIATNTWSTGGFNSSADRLSFAVEGGERIPLGEGWQYAVAEPPPLPPRAPWDANAGIGVMHNRMVAPVGSFAMTGAAWYQGESDVGIPGYEARMRELFAGWRRQFGADMRMLVVQLADFGPTASEPVESGWAEFRDVQRRGVEADANAALVTALDIGEPTDIHPANKVLLGERLALAARGERYGRYLDVDGDGICYRTYPGVHPTMGAFFTRGTSRDPYAVYTEDGAKYAENMDRLLVKFATARKLVPRADVTEGSPGQGAARFGIIHFGTSNHAVRESMDQLAAQGYTLDALRLKAFPFGEEVAAFVAAHDQVFVVEQNRDAQMRSLLINELEINPAQLIPVLNYDGMPLTARLLTGKISAVLDGQAQPVQTVKAMV